MTCSKSTNHTKYLQDLAKALYACANSAAAQPNSRIEKVHWDPKGIVNGDRHGQSTSAAQSTMTITRST